MEDETVDIVDETITPEESVETPETVGEAVAESSDETSA